MKYINTNKLEKIKLNNKNLYIISDFDRTITSFESEDSWDACGGLLSNEFKEKLGQYYKYYGTIEINYNIDQETKEKYMIEWYEKCMNLYYEYGLTKEKLEKSIKESKLIFREGAKEFIEKTKENNIPLIILSAGIGNVIEEFLKINNCYFNNIYIISNFIKFDENGNMKKFEDNMIHSLNKTIEGHLSQKCKNEIKDRKSGILMGDLIDDKKMADKNNIDNIVTVGFLNNEENLELYNKNFDVVLTKNNANFEQIEKLLFKK